MTCASKMISPRGLGAYTAREQHHQSIRNVPESTSRGASCTGAAMAFTGAMTERCSTRGAKNPVRAPNEFTDTQCGAMRANAYPVGAPLDADSLEGCVGRESRRHERGLNRNLCQHHCSKIFRIRGVPLRKRKSRNAMALEGQASLARQPALSHSLILLSPSLLLLFSLQDFS